MCAYQKSRGSCQPTIEHTRASGDDTRNLPAQIFTNERVRYIQQRKSQRTRNAALSSSRLSQLPTRGSRLPRAQLKPLLMQMGMSSNMADLLLEMADAVNSGHENA